MLGWTPKDVEAMRANPNDAKLDAKEKEMKDVKDAIMADIRDKAADVAQEQGFEMIFANYEGIGTATDVTDDIIAKLA